MFGIGETELVLILLFAFMIFGPDKLPGMGKTLGRALRQFRNAQEGFTQVVQTEIVDPATEAMSDNPKKPNRKRVEFDEDADIEHARDFARKVAASIVIAEPFESETTKAMERADKGELSADEFVVLCQALFTSFRIAPQFMFEAKAEWYMTNGMGPNVNKAYLVGAEEIAALNNRLTPLLRRLLDEYDVAKPNASHDDRAKMLNVLSQFTEAAFTGPETFDDEDAHLIVESGILEPSKEFSELKARLADELKQEGLSEA